jgi:hypothetical protein
MSHKAAFTVHIKLKPLPLLLKMDSSNNSSLMPPPLIRKSKGDLKAQDWIDKREVIERLYFTEHRTLPVVMEIMEREHGFLATYVSCSALIATT